MKTRLFIIVISLIAVFACEKPVSDVSCVTDFQMYIEDSELNDVALMLTEIGLDTELCNEVHSSVTAAIEKGLDEDLYFRELWMNSADVKVKPYDSESILKSRLESYFMRNPSTKNSEGNFLKDSDIEIYWPYSENWDGKTFPVIAPVPLGQECDTLYGYKVISIPDETIKLDTVLVDDDYAYENPVWIINHSEIPYEELDMFAKAITINQHSLSKSASNYRYKWRITQMRVKKQYDKLSNGASEFDIVVRFPEGPNTLNWYNKVRLIFTRKEIRDAKNHGTMRTLSETEGMLNDNWDETQVSNLFVLIEADAGGNATTEKGGTISYIDPTTGKTYTQMATYTKEAEDIVMLQRVFNREYVFDLDDDFQHSVDSNNIVWYSPIFEY